MNFEKKIICHQSTQNSFVFKKKKNQKMLSLHQIMWVVHVKFLKR